MIDSTRRRSAGPDDDRSGRPRGAPWVRALGKPILLVAGLAAWGLVGSDRVPVGLIAVAHAASDTEVERYLDRLERRGKSDHELSALRIFNRVVLLIKENYFDPKRIDPRQMMVAALDYVEKTVPEVMVDGDAKSPRLKVTVGSAVKEFDVSAVNTPWQMSFTLKEVFEFLSAHLVSRESTRDIEYAAVNGMLSTLDPHSVLLKPEYFKEMKLQTRGEFGGLGFVIAMKEGQLTVIRVLKGTPAHRAGIKGKDQIIKIEEESTVNMDLNEAVARLRGRPDSKVTITIARVGWPEPKRMSLTRAIIQIESVEPRLLAQNVGYIRLKSFQSNTARDLAQAIRELRKQAGGELKGLVLDVRGNPGGLLEQAIQVSDVFHASGTIVTTVGYSDRLREVKKAHADESETEVPLVVLVNRASASASEIVAGAVKNLNRGVVMGTQTFGKGSVQVLYDFPDESALKLTIAQYLTAGEVSIQEVGITPDIALNRSRVQKDRVNLFAPKRWVTEADLERHFGALGAEPTAKRSLDVVPRDRPVEEIRYLRERDEPKKGETPPGEPTDDEDDDVDPDETDDFVEDFEIRYARGFLAAAPFSERGKMLAAAAGFIAERRRQEEDQIARAIEALGVDWSMPTPSPDAVRDPAQAPSPQGPNESGPLGAPRLAVEIRPSAAVKTAVGDPLTVTVTAENLGVATLRRLWAYVESENPLLDRREFLFGTLAPGEKQSWTQVVKLPADLASRRDGVTLKFRDAAGSRFEDFKADLSFVELARPTFAYTWQVVDACAEVCNLDGVAQRGEEIHLEMEVSNVGEGKAFEAVASLKNLADEKIFIKKGRAKLGELLPGQSRAATFVLEVKRGYRGETFPLRLVVGDEKTEEYLAQKLSLPVLDAGPRPVAKKAVLRLNGPSPVYAAANAASEPLAQLARGVTVAAHNQVADFFRVEFAKGRLGYLPVAAAREVKRLVPAKEKEIVVLRGKQPPRIELAVNTAAGPVVTHSERYTLSGVARDPKALRDVYLFVNDQKVYFHTSPATAPETEVPFSAEFPLKIGNNHVLVVASEDADLNGRRTMVIHRVVAELAQKPPTPPIPAP